MSTRSGWGPSHQTEKRKGRLSPGVQLLLLFVIVCAYPVISANWLLLAIAAGVVLLISTVVTRVRARLPTLIGDLVMRTEDPLATVREVAVEHGGGVYLGIRTDGDWRFARPERAVLLLGPPGPVSHCSLRDRHCANSPASNGSTWILRPFRRPAVTWTAWRSPRWT
ncbi:MAG: hypothetical protein ACYDHH_17795 [Solirubrobacteraceae bacterium]